MICIESSLNSRKYNGKNFNSPNNSIMQNEGFGNFRTAMHSTILIFKSLQPIATN